MTSGATRSRIRSLVGDALALGPGLALLLLSVTREGLARGGPHRLPFLLSEALSVVGITLLMRVAAAREGVLRWLARGALVAEALVVGAQIFARGAFQAELDEVAIRSARTFGSGAVGFVLTQPKGMALAFGIPWLVAVIAPLVLVRVDPTPPATARVRALLLIPIPLVTALGFGYVLPLDRALSPDVLFAGSLTRSLIPSHTSLGLHGFVTPNRPHERHPHVVPTLTPSRSHSRSVLLILGESVRADVVCDPGAPACTTTPFTNEAVPGRIALRQMRSVDSTTAILLGVLLTGLAADASEQDLHTAPLIFEYARAAGMRTAYWTSQSMAFGNAGQWLAGVPFDRHVSATDLEPGAWSDQGADDADLLPIAADELESLKPPYFAVVHLSNTHHSYRIDEREAPFQPQSAEVDHQHAVELKNRYLDALYHQDHLVARFLQSFRAAPGANEVVVVFVSDHGEAFFEKPGVGFHTMSVDDTEIRVPFWIDAPPGTLTDAEIEHLRVLRDAPVTMLDVAPTLLALLGIADLPAVAPFLKAMPGESLLGPRSPSPRTIRLTNCGGLWGCTWPDYGVMAGTRKLTWRFSDGTPRCFDVASDPTESNDLGEGACAALAPEFAVIQQEGQTLYEAILSTAK